MHKKAASEWISYVLLTGFVVAIAAFLFVWMTGFASEKAVEIKGRVFDTELCGSVAASITACNISQNLYINVTNRGDIRISQLIFRLENNTGYVFNETNTTIKPKNTKSFNFTQIKVNNTTAEVVPATIKEEFLVVCTEKKAAAEIRSC